MTQTTFTLRKLTGPEVIYLWPYIQNDLLANAELWEKTQNIENFKNSLLKGDYQLLVVLDEAGVVQLHMMTQLVFFPKCMTFKVLWGFGQGAAQIVVGMDVLEKYAKDLGCSRVEVHGRPAWLRLLKPHGYELVYQVIGKELEGRTTEH